MAIPFTTAIEVLDATRDELLEEKHSAQEIIEAAEDYVRQLNTEIASLSAAMNALDNEQPPT